MIYQFLCAAFQQQTVSLRLLPSINTESLSGVLQKRKQQLSILHYKHIKASDFPLPIIHPQAEFGAAFEEIAEAAAKICHLPPELAFVFQ